VRVLQARDDERALDLDDLLVIEFRVRVMGVCD
jgi:hypothetical protein